MYRYKFNIRTHIGFVEVIIFADGLGDALALAAMQYGAENVGTWVRLDE